MLQNNFFEYDTPYFTQVWDNVESFVTDYHEVKIPDTISEESVSALFYLLYAKYGNSTIAFTDVNQFKYNVFSTIFMYGPTWEERLSLQEKIRNLTDDEIMQGSKAIYNSALNPGTVPTTQSLEELRYINQQNTTNYKKSKIEAIALKWELLRSDVTGDFLRHFQGLFRSILDPGRAVSFYEYENN